jgi:peptide deformylase
VRRELHILGSPVLRKKSVELDPQRDSEFISELLADMWRILHSREGLGLAAPQAGENVRLFILDSENVLSMKGHRIFINPEIETLGPDQKAEEGCLSIPGLYEQVKRSNCVKVSALDQEGQPFSLELDGLVARAVQHEFDHLQGVLFIDRLSPVRRRLLRSRLAGIREEARGRS